MCGLRSRGRSTIGAGLGCGWGRLINGRRLGDEVDSGWMEQKGSRSDSEE